MFKTNTSTSGSQPEHQDTDEAGSWVLLVLCEAWIQLSRLVHAETSNSGKGKGRGRDDEEQQEKEKEMKKEREEARCGLLRCWHLAPWHSQVVAELQRYAL
jgi:hypothetical protein